MTIGTSTTKTKQFVDQWTGRGYERGESQTYWLTLLRDVLGVENPEELISFENRVKLSNTGFIDAYIESTKVLIEQKSIQIDLRQSTLQSDGTMLTPYQQAKRYAAEMPYSMRPRWVVTCNFRSMLIYDMEHPQREPEEVLLCNLPQESYRLKFLVDTTDHHIRKEVEVSIKAGEIVGKLYDALIAEYLHPEDDESLRSLNILCVRIVFCLYAEDAGLFGRHGLFHDYLRQFTPERMRAALIELFAILDTPIEKRDPYIDDALLSAFPYVNGGLFAERGIEIPRFNEQIATLLLANASDNFDWSQISPTIFGAVFESTLNPSTRRTGGMHYTSVENIHKVIDPLFMDDLHNDFTAATAIKDKRRRNSALTNLQKRISRLTFLDPACGSGNFLTETYLSLRRLENDILRHLSDGMVRMGGDIDNPIMVSIHQMYGVEINDFAVTVAKTALWIAESQMMLETKNIVQQNLDILPLRSYANIVEGNALAMDWSEFPTIATKPVNIIAHKTYITQLGSPLAAQEPTVRYGDINLQTEEIVLGTARPKTETAHVDFDYIIGNPPFVGARNMNDAQKADLENIFGKTWKNRGNLDYVACWYKKVADLISHNDYPTRCALVSTNSICQGESVANLWQPLILDGIHIDFAYRTFVWDSESEQLAHVHCVIVGFSAAQTDKPKYIFDGDKKTEAQNINAYLMDADNVFVGSRNQPLCDVPQIGIGNKPIDDGNYLFSHDEMLDFISREPDAAQYFKPWYGAQEFINNRPRYCLWLGDCTPAQLRKMPRCMERVRNVRLFRLASKSPGTVKLADRPTRFHVENMPQSSFIAIPETSSERRKYIPIGFLSPDNLCSNAIRIMPDATLYHFGILTSSVHMAWMRTVCGRLKSDYRYSKDIVYNNFPWPDTDEKTKQKITLTAQAILDARALYPESSLADLYDDTTMPLELRRAHQANDKAVAEAYKLSAEDIKSDSVCMTHLFSLYKNLNSKNQITK